MRNHPWVREILAVGQPMALYGAGVALAMATFTATILLTQEEVDLQDYVILSAMWVCCVVGVLGGQLVSISRLRSGFVLPSLFVAFWLGIGFIANYEDQVQSLLGREAAGAVFISLILFPIVASGGFWSLRVNRGLAAAWAPSMLFIVSILVWSEEQGRDELWHQGSKHAIWSAGTVAVLALAVAMQIVFMVARERHRLHRWRTSALAPELVDERPDPLRPFSGLGTLLLLSMLVLALTGGSAVVAPYLWRTGPGDDPEDGPIDPSDDPRDSWQAPQLSPPEIIRHVRQGAGVTCSLITLLVLALAALLVFGPPTRRQLLLSHLRDPMWPVPPSRRARLHWRLAEIALGDAGILRQPGEAARDVAARGVAALPGLHLEALVTAAEIADRVAYGYALEASDADTIRRAAEMTYQAVWDSMGEVDRIKATYRLL